jgi:hypothetical protein
VSVSECWTDSNFAVCFYSVLCAAECVMADGVIDLAEAAAKRTSFPCPPLPSLQHLILPLSPCVCLSFCLYAAVHSIASHLRDAVLFVDDVVLDVLQSLTPPPSNDSTGSGGGSGGGGVLKWLVSQFGVRNVLPLYSAPTPPPLIPNLAALMAVTPL